MPFWKKFSILDPTEYHALREPKMTFTAIVVDVVAGRFNRLSPDEYNTKIYIANAFRPAYVARRPSSCSIRNS